MTGESSKLDDIRERLVQLSGQGHKALVFSQYASETFGVKAAAEFLRAFSPVMLTGDMPLEERSVAIERFRRRDEHKAMVISLRAGGLGLNLQEASYVFHLDRWWNPAVERQAEDRAHRMGQTVKVNVIKYSCAGTIEERIDRILERKQRLFDQLIDDVSLNLSARLSGEELFSLFGLDPPSVQVVDNSGPVAIVSGYEDCAQYPLFGVAKMGKSLHNVFMAKLCSNATLVCFLALPERPRTYRLPSATAVS